MVLIKSNKLSKDLAVSGCVAAGMSEQFECLGRGQQLVSRGPSTLQSGSSLSSQSETTMLLSFFTKSRFLHIKRK